MNTPIFDLMNEIVSDASEKVKPKTKYITVSVSLLESISCIVDEEDYDKLTKFTWRLWDNHGYFYAINNKKYTMHRLVTDAKIYDVVDHINHDTLDNRKSNLRIVRNRQNIFNSKPHKNSTSQYKGVAWHKNKNKWIASIGVNKKNIYLGIFANEVDAAKAYNDAATKYFGEFAYLNTIS